MLGYPGAGKTTAAKIIQKLTSAEYLSSDELRGQLFTKSSFTQEEHDKLYGELDGQLDRIMGMSKNVIYDANLNRHIHRQEKYDLAKKYEYKTVLVWVQTPKEVARRRRVEEAAHHHLVPSHETPLEMFERSAKVFEQPEGQEEYISLDGTKLDQDYVLSALLEAGLDIPRNAPF